MLVIEVNGSHIENGERYSESRCPVGLAMAGQGCTDINIAEVDMCFDYNGVWYEIDTPPAIASFIRSFDEGQMCLPFDCFILE